MRTRLSTLILITLIVLCLAAAETPSVGQAAAGSGKSGAKGTTADAVTKAIAYGESVIGAPYVWWKGGPLPKKAPMWTADGPPPDPAAVRKEGANCAGLTNLMLRAIGKRVPHVKELGQGGTGVYGKYYEKVAHKFDVKRKYPPGTLIGRHFRDVNSQGHVAVVLANGHVLQAIPHEGVNKTYTVKQSHGKGYYEYAVLPEDWLGEGAR